MVFEPFCYERFRKWIYSRDDEQYATERSGSSRTRATLLLIYRKRSCQVCSTDWSQLQHNSAGLWNRFSLMSLIITPATRLTALMSCVNFHNYNCSTSTPKLAKTRGPSRPFVHCTNMDRLKLRTASDNLYTWEVGRKCLNHLVWWIAIYYLPWIPIHDFTKNLTVWMGAHTNLWQ